MTLNGEMSASAKTYAATLARSGRLKHSNRDERSGQGENLAYGCSSGKGISVTDMVKNW